MAKLALIYGMRLLPEDDLGEVRDATVVLKNGRSARVAHASDRRQQGKNRGHLSAIHGSIFLKCIRRFDRRAINVRGGGALCSLASGFRSFLDRRWDRQGYR